ncbi:DNA-binding transcriptional repressor [uncultured Pleomorphomonas sp.]|uniref:Transcriptional regulator n=2 Tax=Pleomorphomonas TaxID=261933 RepID=A0A2G9X1S9_9HYPH|nr:IclR family transcriptional regulator [Pleomorphomonas carboxyditropha]PIP00864.1 transcriptional regulator [Pleomorphomonas carboxyditropha]SCM72929.1 DNA-binding transcriptional repressor [uncultured Pleomorphomonas sp.]
MSEMENAPGQEPPAGSQSLLRGLQLVEILSNFPNGCPLAKLSELAGLNKSTTHRLLQGLESAGYVTRAPSPGSYRLTTKFVAIGQKTLSSLNIIHVAAPHLEALNLDVGETINFSTREDDHAIMIYKLEPTVGMIRTRTYIGQHLPLFCSAMGKIFLAHDKPANFEAYWQSHRSGIVKLTANTIVDHADMLHELAAIRADNYALDREENELGVSCVAAPVFDIQGRVPYAASISLSTARLEKIGLASLLGPLKETARRISAELGAQL